MQPSDDVVWDSNFDHLLDCAALVGYVKGGGQVNRDGQCAFVPLEAFLECLGNIGNLSRGSSV
jgi:hypothetical protein